MKKLILFLFASTIFLSCGDDTPENQDGVGTLSLNLGLDIKANPIGGRTDEVVAIEDFLVIIFREDGTVFQQFDRAADIPSEVELPTGVYRVTASSNNESFAEFDNPFYYGESELFSIDKEELKVVTVTCTLDNMKVTVNYSENVINTFDTYSTTVQSDAGGVLIYNESETREGYFSVSPLQIEATLTYTKTDGSVLTKTFTGAVTDPQPKTRYEINVDAIVQDGQIVINIELDETVDLIGVELGETVNAGNLSNGDLLITEVFQNPLFSDIGLEYFEVFNNTSNAVNLIGKIVQDLGADSFTIDQDLIIQPYSYFVFQSGNLNTLVDISNDYIYTGMVLGNADDEIIIFNSDMTEIVRLEYDGGPIFPDPTGASMILDPSCQSIDCMIDGSNWCVSITEMDFEEKGTPGSVNESCSLDYDGDGYSVEMGDCDDYNYLIFPSSAFNETCNNGIDDNCDGLIDNTCVTDVCDGLDNDNDGNVDNITWYQDTDGDGYGSSNIIGTSACSQPVGSSMNSLDCDDSDDSIYPGSPEICGNMIDEDCTGQVDDGC
ncbi:MAG: DUF4493 domain-containing protein [Fulvivirga sp.]|uniref:DUF4493 domain-containing protein n=1 Tax=Fulvivirga sp. TaxID=1931237 RepID=UPI0032EC9353